MLTLYYSPGACSLAAHIVLEWIGAPYEAVHADHHDPAYRKINPAAAVPALDYGGPMPLTQCAAILNYLAARYPQTDLLDTRSLEAAAELMRWAAFFTGDMHPAFWPVFMPGRYTTDESETSLAAVKQAGLKLVRTKLELLEAQLNGKTWIVGDKRTLVDAYATPMLNWAKAMLPEGLGDYPAVQAHRRRMLADPAVQRALKAEGLQALLDEAAAEDA